ncbi:bidirectional sugar transporter SWEET4-like [Wolffia australiana]
MVSADQAKTVAGILGNIISLALFLSPLPTFVTICRRKTVERFSAAPYLAALLNCLLWVLYGLPWVHPHSPLILTINGAGTAIELAYVILFLVHSEGHKRRRIAAAFLAELLFVAAATAVVLNLPLDHHDRSLFVGCLCVVFGALMYAAPLSVMKLVIKTRSVEFLPLGLSVASFANGLCWTCYALIGFDLFIIIPNGVGVILAAVQLVLHAVFHKSTQRQIAARRSTVLTVVTVNQDSDKMTLTPAQANGLHPSPEAQEK